MNNLPNTTLKSFPRWLWLSAIALATSLVSVYLDFQHHLWGGSTSVMTGLQALHVLLLGLFYAWWGLSLAWASHGEKRGVVSLFGATLAWSFLANGLGGIYGCFPPCDALAPYVDIFHIGNIVLGGMASYAIWKAIKANPEQGSWKTILVPIGLFVAIWVIEGILFFAK